MSVYDSPTDLMAAFTEEVRKAKEKGGFGGIFLVILTPSALTGISLVNRMAAGVLLSEAELLVSRLRMAILEHDNAHGNVEKMKVPVQIPPPGEGEVTN